MFSDSRQRCLLLYILCVRHDELMNGGTDRAGTRPSSQSPTRQGAAGGTLLLILSGRTRGATIRYAVELLWRGIRVHDAHVWTNDGHGTRCGRR